MQPLVLFDLDNTLIDRSQALSDWAAVFCEYRKLGEGEARWLHELLKYRAGPADFVAVRDRLHLDETAEQLWAEYRAGIAAVVRCPSDVLVGLDELRVAGWRVGIATNGATDIQWAKLRATGISECVDAVCVSEEAGARKPAGAFFSEAVRRCRGGVGGDGWMVGDSPVNDIGGGREAGLRTVWVNRGGGWPEGLAGPDHEVSGARAAIDLLIAIQRMRKLS